MVLHSAKENGPQYQALVNFSQKLDAAIKQWDSYLEPGGVLEQRLAAEMAQLPEQAPEEVQTSAIEAALGAVSPEAQEKFLLERLAGEYENRLAAEQARLGPNATPEQARASLYREELTESFREPLRKAAYSPQQLEKNREDAALALAAEKRDAMDAGARQAYEKDKAQLRNNVIARRIRNKLLEAGQDEDFRKAFLDDQMPTAQDREQYYLAHNREADLVNKNLSPGQIRARAAELANQPDFNNFILKIRSDPALQRKAISAVGEGHGGGLDDLFSEYLARKAPGELPLSEDLKRWAPSALQRIEGLQEQLRQGNLDEFQAKKRVAEIIAARKLVGARRAGFLQHADQRLNQKLTDPAKLNAKAGDLETCLNMLTSEQIQDLARQAKEGHGGAMLESFKKLNTVKLHMDEIKRGLAFNPKYKVDAALAMAIYKENAQNPDAQLDDTRAMRTAAALRGLPFYKEFEQREETADKLKQNVDIGGLYNDYVQLKDEHKPEKQNPEEHPRNELLEEEGPRRTSTQESVLNWQ